MSFGCRLFVLDFVTCGCLFVWVGWLFVGCLPNIV